MKHSGYDFRFFFYSFYIKCCLLTMLFDGNEGMCIKEESFELKNKSKVFSQGTS